MSNPHPEKYIKIAAAQAAKHAGFTSATPEALNLLSDSFAAYLLTVSALTKSYTTHASRTRPNMYDMHLALTDLGIDVSDLAAFVEDVAGERPRAGQLQKEENPYLEQFKYRGFRSTNEVTPRPKYVPEYMPEFPSPHTYMRTSVIDEPDTNGLKNRERQAEESRLVETNLRKLVFGTGSLFDSEALEKVVNYEAAVERGGSRKVQGVAGGV